MECDLKECIPIFKALADETRLKIIKLIANKELCACHILENFQITQPTLSYHMKILVDSNLVTAEKKGSWMHYKLNSEKIQCIKGYIEELEK